MATRRRTSRLAITAVVLIAAAPAGAATYMSCDARFEYDIDSGFQLDRDSLKWRARPRACRHEIDGTNAGSINLVDLRWRAWGRRTATAQGFQTANHADQNGMFPRSAVTVTVRGRTRACRRGRSALFYSRIRVQVAGEPPAQWLRLYVPRKRRC